MAARKPPPLDQLQLYTIRQTSALLGVSKSTVYRLIADGSLKVVDVAPKGSRKSMSRVRADHLADFIDKRTS